MNDVVCCDQEPDFSVGWDHQRLIDLEQVVVAFSFRIVNLFLRRRQVREKGDVFARLVQILILPLPLMSRYQHVEFSLVVVIDL